jgi:hypothetical protein
MAVTPKTLRLAQRARRDLLRIADTHTRELTKAWVDAWDDIAGDLEKALVELISTTRNGVLTQATILRSTRLQQALDVVARRLTRLTDDAGRQVARDLVQVVRAAGETQAEIIASQLPKAERDSVASWSNVDQRQVDAIVQRSTERITSQMWPLSAEADAAVRRELVRGLLVGEGPRKTAAAILDRTEGAFNGGLSRALTIARTETLDAHRRAAQVAHSENASALRGWMWLAATSTRTCPACLGMNGTEHPLTEPGPLGHQNCVLPGAVVSGPRATASTTRWFDGEVVDIQSASGHLLSVTPNHPILTTHGWVAAGKIHEGMHVISSPGPQGMPGGDRPDDHQIPALIEDVAQALGRSSAVPAVAMPTAAEDFHGDGAGSQVHVVRTDSRLVHDALAELAQQRRQQQFAVGDVSLTSLSGGGSLDQLLSTPNASSTRFVGSRGIASVLFARATSAHESIRLSAVALRHTCGREAGVDHGPRYSVGLRQRVHGFAALVTGDEFRFRQRVLSQLGAPEFAGLLDLGLLSGAPQPSFSKGSSEASMAYPVPTATDLAAFAGDVIADRVLKVRRRAWSGHVYNLQTATGWFVANGILTHNCRCARVPVTKSWKDLGIDIDEPEPTATGSQAWFDSQPEATQRKILGPAKYAAYQRGDFPMSKWAVRRSNDGWRDSYVPAPAPKPR